ncbi:MAG: ribosome biogenesis GTPase Der, partial [bacterium]|nr:ribosome biogenesis GTPase Der [bacterium]
MLTIALIGRTNVGKSTLFNRILGESKALTSALPHTTRDRNMGTTEWRGVSMRWIDTGGVEEVDHPRRTRAVIEHEIRRQVQVATEEADVLALVVDVHDGILPGEHEIGRYLRTLRKPIVVICNKVSNARDRLSCAEFSALGFGEATPVAATSGVGVGDLLDRIVTLAPEESEGTPTIDATRNDTTPGAGKTEKGTKIAIVGEPNVGKSSLLNGILGRDEVIVRPEPFTTRDVHDVDIEVEGRTLTLLDTAGIRRLAARAARSSGTRIEAIERLAVRRSLGAIVRADVVCLVLDATNPATRHVKQLATAIIDAGRACVIVVNKVDQFDTFDGDAVRTNVLHALPHLAWAIIVSTSAVTGAGVAAIIPACLRADAAWKRLLESPALAAIHGQVKHRIPVARTPIGRKRSHVVELRQ